MNRSSATTKTAGALLCAALLCLAVAAASAHADTLEPRGKNVFFGISDTGDSADFGGFSELTDKHPALIQTFRTWGSDFPESIERWQAARARPVLHITTADNNDGHELITPRGIAKGDGDAYLVRLNKLFWAKKMPAYIRPLGEPNRCLNVYASYDCEGAPRGAAHRPRWYKLAFRRIYVIVHGGGKRGEIDARLAQAGLPPLNVEVQGLPKAPVALLWSTLPAGSPTVPQNRPRHFYPGDDYVDWVGTDVYSDNQDWKALAGLYRRYNDKPFALPEWGVVGADDPRFVRRLLTWVDRHRRCKMLVYYQDFGATSSYRIQNYPASLGVLRSWLHHPRIPHFAPNPPKAPPPPPGGVAPKSN
ncbi:MAG TPA: glycosyl hydrolase [Solirubrobacterales bacterium]|nr:glycosyl hydrolase [Solirubrobacterales bacterium]